MIVRADVPVGVQAAMIIHAAGLSAQLPGACSAAPPTVIVVRRCRLAGRCRVRPAVALLASSVDELLAIHRALDDADLPHVLVREPDEPWRASEPPARREATGRIEGSASEPYRNDPAAAAAAGAWRDAPMAIGVVPMPRARVRRHLARLPLVRGLAKELS